MSDWETVCDPVEEAFTVAMPLGWKNRAWLERRGPAAHNLAVATSPDGSTALFMGDPKLPFFVEPAAAAFALAGTEVRPFTSIEHFLPAYAQDRFGRLPGFRPLRMMPSRDLHQIVLEKVMRSGAAQPWVTAGTLEFELASDGPPIHGLLFGSSILVVSMWWVEILGVTTTGAPEDHAPTLLAMLTSRQATPAMQQRQVQERAASAAAHRDTMATLDTNAAILLSNHQHNMATLGAMADAHQGRMAALHDTHDQANAAWQARQPDDAHRRFLNLIAEERTVIDGQGDTHQVTDGYDRYFRRRSDGTWIGTRNDRDLYGLPGIDPADFEEMKIKV